MAWLHREDTSEEAAMIKKNQMEMLKLRSTMNEIKMYWRVSAVRLNVENNKLWNLKMPAKTRENKNEEK